ncbi:16S rRNA (guanine(966)-N(2))-methyltransferase RsmD [Thermodesulfobacteriota bacterium]
MRITGGLAKGRHLAPLKGLKIRPSSDLVRESIFNILGQNLTGLMVLDLFAGTGSLGIEALSRGASRALFIDRSWQAIKVIKQNLKLCGYTNSGDVLKRDLTLPLPRKQSTMKKKIDLVFLDPPYGQKLLVPLLEQISDRGIMTSPSTVIAECAKSDVLPVSLGCLQLINQKTYGETCIYLYHFEEEKCVKG